MRQRWLAGDVILYLSTTALLPGVLGRVCAAVATRAHFTLDRHSDLELITDAIASGVSATSPDRGVGFAVAALGRWIELKVGPLAPGVADVLRPGALNATESGGLRISPLEQLADGVSVERRADSEMLHVWMFDRPQPAAERSVPLSGCR
jgi:hypothetical protein